MASEKILPFLTKLFHTIFDSHEFPESWSRSIIVPIHKKGDKTNTNNYRGISLLCALSKVFTAIFARRLRVWMELEKKIGIEQAGFRAKHTTVDHIFTLHATILKHVYSVGRGKLDVAFIDYNKAFDSVNRKTLWCVLQKAGISTKFSTYFFL